MKWIIKNIGSSSLMVAGEVKKLEFAASIPDAKLWEIKNANLYNLVAVVKNN